MRSMRVAVVACMGLVAAQVGWGQGGAVFQDHLMPRPAVIRAGTGSYALKAGLTASVTGAVSPRAERAVARAMRRLEDRTGLAMSRSVGRDGAAGLFVVVRADDGAVQGVEEDESYTLRASETGVRIEAAGAVGAMHGLETLLQLVQAEGAGYVVPAMEIQDRPRFRWRGLMIDCVRHFEPIEVLRRNLDAMAAVKLNVFHWHLTDDQGFRIESRRSPQLTAKGSDGLFYTQEQARELVQYARDRGIRVVPEFEMPGHSTAWLVAYPELASGTTPTGIRREFGISEYVLDPTREETYKFIGSFLSEMAAIFPDQYMHIGGDEAPAPDWKKNPRILSFMQEHKLENNDALQAHFNQHINKLLTGLGKRMVGWDEIANPALPKDVVVQSWRGEASLVKGAQQGYQGVLSAPYYLDAMKPAGVHYLADPLPKGTPLTAEQQRLILGGEVCMWAEHLDERTIDSRIWPRTAAIAERFWSTQDVRDVDDMYRRLTVVSVELEGLGIRHIASGEAGLRSLAGSDEIDALRTVAQAFEPASFSDRYRQQHTSQLTPLTNWVDAVRPDPPIRQELEVATRQFLAHRGEDAGTAAREMLLQFFRELGAAVPQVQAGLTEKPRLQAIEERMRELGVLAATGQQAVQMLSTKARAPDGWKQRSLAEIEQAKKPSAIVRFTFLEPLTLLVNANE